jgi:oligogalacturonide transporter
MADVDGIVTGRRREGAFAGVMTFVRKATQAMAVMVVGLVLQAGGFVSGATTQTPAAIHSIVLVMSVVTIVVLVCGAFVSLRFRLDRRTHAILMAEIDRFKTGATTPSSAEARDVVEDLSGFAYARLWGKNSVAQGAGTNVAASATAPAKTN